MSSNALLSENNLLFVDLAENLDRESILAPWEKHNKSVFSHFNFVRVRNSEINKHRLTTMELKNIIKILNKEKCFWIGISNNVQFHMLESIDTRKYFINYFAHGFGDLALTRGFYPLSTHLRSLLRCIIKLSIKNNIIYYIYFVYNDIYTSCYLDDNISNLKSLNGRKLKESYERIGKYLILKDGDFINLKGKTENAKSKKQRIILVSLAYPSFSLMSNKKYLNEIESLIELNVDKKTLLIFKLRIAQTNPILIIKFKDQIRRHFLKYNFIILGDSNNLNLYPLELFAVILKPDFLISGSASINLNTKNIMKIKILSMIDYESKFMIENHLYTKGWKIERKYYRKIYKKLNMNESTFK
jgi:hypothetical protein